MNEEGNSNRHYPFGRNGHQNCSDSLRVMNHKKNYEYAIDHSRSFIEDFGRLLTNQCFIDHHDVIIRIEGQEFFLHRIILAARSEYFRALFYDGMKEASMKIIELKCMKKRTFERIIQYIYTGTINFMNESERELLELLAVVHEYGFGELEDALSQFMEHLLHHSNAVHIYEMARLYQLDRLMEMAARHIEYNATEIFMDHSFYQISSDAFCDILQRNTLCLKEIDLFKTVYNWHTINGASSNKKLLSCVRYHLMKMDDLLNDIHSSSLLSAEYLLNLIKQNYANTYIPSTTITGGNSGNGTTTTTPTSLQQRISNFTNQFFQSVTEENNNNGNNKKQINENLKLLEQKSSNTETNDNNYGIESDNEINKRAIKVNRINLCHRDLNALLLKGETAYSWLRRLPPLEESMKNEDNSICFRSIIFSNFKKKDDISTKTSTRRRQPSHRQQQTDRSNLSNVPAISQLDDEESVGSADNRNQQVIHSVDLEVMNGNNNMNNLMNSRQSSTSSLRRRNNSLRPTNYYRYPSITSTNSNVSGMTNNPNNNNINNNNNNITVNFNSSRSHHQTATLTSENKSDEDTDSNLTSDDDDIQSINAEELKKYIEQYALGNSIKYFVPVPDHKSSQQSDCSGGDDTVMKPSETSENDNQNLDETDLILEEEKCPAIWPSWVNQLKDRHTFQLDMLNNFKGEKLDIVSINQKSRYFDDIDNIDDDVIEADDNENMKRFNLCSTLDFSNTQTTCPLPTFSPNDHLLTNPNPMSTQFGSGYMIHPDFHVVRHPIDGHSSIILKLAAPCLINHMFLCLWNVENRLFSYYIEVAFDCDSKLNGKWKKIIDHTQYLCRSKQCLIFEEVVAQYIRIVGTHSSGGNALEIVNFAVYYIPDIWPIDEQSGLIIPKRNVASIEFSASITEGVSRSGDSLIDDDFSNYDWEYGYTCHQIHNGCISIRLAQPYVLSSMRFLLWDCDERSYSYYVQTSLDPITDKWTIVADRRSERCSSWQIIEFPPRKVMYIKLVGVHSTFDEVFHCVHFESPCDERYRHKANNNQRQQKLRKELLKKPRADTNNRNRFVRSRNNQYIDAVRRGNINIDDNIILNINDVTSTVGTIGSSISEHSQ
ncbi:hypothetical protein SNEBB_002581 [Seison nebaliae]|nr:hypothetical protein SNEBB_002581 [Seison nebaliae]